jgi:Cytochrome P460
MRHHTFSIAVGVAALLTTIVVIRASDPPEVPYPSGFRSWQHVKSIIIGPEHRSFANRGGIHHYYANEQAMTGYRTGTFANGSIIVDEGVFTKDGEDQAKGILLEAGRRSLDVMVKNDRLYKDTGGWGFQHFDRETTTGTLNAEARGKCEECHANAKRDHVFSSVRP